MEYYNKPYMNKADLKRAYKAGYIDLIYKQLSRYGVITSDNEWDTESGYYKGANRHLKITHFKTDWNIELLNGRVRSLGFKY